MREFEVIVLGRFSEFFPAEDEEDAEAEMLRQLPRDFIVDEIEVIEYETLTD